MLEVAASVVAPSRTEAPIFLHLGNGVSFKGDGSLVVRLKPQ